LIGKTHAFSLHGPANDLTVWRGFHLQREDSDNNVEQYVMKLTTLFAVLAALVVFVHPAQARHRHLHRMQEGYADTEQRNMFSGQVASARRSGGRPAAWCGWQMRQLVGGDPGSAFNLARNWARWGQPGPAGVGAVIVWSHHVGKIVGQQDGMWVIESGNDGHAVRARPRSIAGAIAIRWG
jgi:hypothetical protein